ncbi:hypothetical protein [Stenotrophomonas sp. PD6]|uniref:hypothetical protein n=1 Tax=Stenotrophomonas sp. PD6 TaxID=3368612 RepID=UPI003BA06BA7
MKEEELLSLIKAFVSGNDVGIEAANRMEMLLDDSFPDDDYLQETIEMLACYRPEGGREVLGIESIRRRLMGIGTYLQDKNHA